MKYCSFFLFLAAALVIYPLYSPAAEGSHISSSSVLGTNEGISDITIYEIGSDFSWGYKSGVKQIIGSYQKGISLHQISRHSDKLGDDELSNPDNILWVNENTGEYGISIKPTGNTGTAVNSGGHVEFDDQGYIYYVYGARAQDIAFDLYKSIKPYDVNNFEKILNDFETTDGSSTPSIWIDNTKVMLSWRYRGSTRTEVRCRHIRYDTSDFNNYENKIDIGRGKQYSDGSAITIEQQWTRYDPRFNELLASFSYFNSKTSPKLFGSSGWFSSPDYGDTWYMADGIQYDNLPRAYPDVDMAYDHLQNQEYVSWFPFELALTPDGTPCMVMHNRPTPNTFHLLVYFFRNNDWQLYQIPEALQTPSSYALGITQNNVVITYVRKDESNKLYTIISRDNGKTWDGPHLVDTLSDEYAINFISFFQPSESYEDDYCRFIYSYYNHEFGSPGKDNIKFVKYNTENGNEPPDGPDIYSDDKINLVGTDRTFNWNYNIQNIGEEYSSLSWEIIEWPGWGTWKFDHIAGENLKPNDGEFQISASVFLSEKTAKKYKGRIKIVNTDNTADYCIIDVLITKNKDTHILKLLRYFPVIKPKGD